MGNKGVLGSGAEPAGWRTRAFFEYWRQRAAFIEALSLPAHVHEANVLVWAALDALANLWAGQPGQPQLGKRSAFDTFLARYGGEPFQRVSMPDVWHRASRPDCELDPSARDVLRALDRQEDSILTRGHRDVAEDPDLETVVKRVLLDCDCERTSLEAWLHRSRFGAIAYKRLRSAFIHEGRPGRDTHSFQLYGSATNVTYLSPRFATPAVLGFAPTFMVSALRRCIDAFEQDALERNLHPVPRG